jgi:putative transposase
MNHTNNARTSAFFNSLLDRRRFRSHSEARMAVFSFIEFIEGFYNPSRRHSALGYLAPIQYERLHHELNCPP